MRAPRFDLDGKAAGEVDLPAALFEAPVRRHLIHLAATIEAANRRRGTHKTKRRGEVSGGGRKPWKQKGTGRARQGSTRAPHWRHGGTVFGPQPRSYAREIPRRARRAALFGALSERAKEGRVVVLAAAAPAPLAVPKTSRLWNFLCAVERAIGRDVRRPLFLIGDGEETIARSVRNIPGAARAKAGNLSTRTVVASDLLVATEAGLAAASSRYAGKREEAA